MKDNLIRVGDSVYRIGFYRYYPGKKQHPKILEIKETKSDILILVEGEKLFIPIDNFARIGNGDWPLEKKDFVFVPIVKRVVRD